MTIEEQIMKLQTYKMYEGEDTVYVERDDILKLLEQQPKMQDCEHCIHTYGTLGCCDMVNNEWVYDCEFGKEQYKKEHETQPCEDAISREDAIREAYIKGYDYGVKDWFKAKTEPCDDCISRQALIEKATSWDKHFADSERCVSLTEIQNAPPVKPQRPSGKWVNNIHDIPICDQCGYMTPYDRAIDDYEYGNFCPNCGAKMAESETP